MDLFSGIGGLSLALAPWVKPVAYCEIEPFARGVLLSRMQDGSLPVAPIWDDVRTLTAEHLRAVDLIYGGFPCQPFSTAARGRNNAADLWPEMLRLVREIAPQFVFAENVARGAIDQAARELARLGYVVRCCPLSAAHVGAVHERPRYWLLADANRDGELRRAVNEEMAGISSPVFTSLRPQYRPELLGTDDGLPARVDRLRALGNAVVPAQAREAFCRLMGLTDQKGHKNEQANPKEV